MPNYKEQYKSIFKGTLDLEARLFSPQNIVNFIAMIAFSAVFGLVVGSFQGSRQMVFVAIKVPMLMMITSFITFPFMLITGLIIDGKTNIKSIFNSVIYILTQTSVIMLGLIPLMWLFVQSGEYRLSILALAAIFIISGGFALVRINLMFSQFLKSDAAKILFITFVWGIIYTFVAGQIWWLMRPWVGYTVVKRDLPFVRPLSEDEISNVYESIQLTSKTWYDRKIAN